MTVGGQVLLQKDLDDTLRRVAIPEFRTFSRLTIAGQYLARLRIYLFKVLPDNMVSTSGDRHWTLGVFSQR